MRYSSSASGPWSDRDHRGTGTSTTLSGLTPNTRYWVQVQARNDEGTGDWSPASNAPTSPNSLPSFRDTGAASSRSLPENTPGGTDIGDPVGATDVESSDLTYILEGDDAASFEIDASTGQLSTAGGVEYDFESGKTSYSVTVTATDEHDGVTRRPVTITITDVEEKPGTPPAPDVDSATLESLTISWQEPENTGPEVNDYNLRYRKGNSGPWEDAGFEGSERTTILEDLEQSQDYQIQVQAQERRGDRRLVGQRHRAHLRQRIPVVRPAGQPRPVHHRRERGGRPCRRHPHRHRRRRRRHHLLPGQRDRRPGVPGGHLPGGDRHRAGVVVQPRGAADPRLLGARPRTGREAAPPPGSP